MVGSWSVITSDALLLFRNVSALHDQLVPNTLILVRQILLRQRRPGPGLVERR
jgi:hypothetical protein